MLNPRGPSRLPRGSVVSGVLQAERPLSAPAFDAGTYPNIGTVGLASPTNGTRSLAEHGSWRLQFDAPGLLTRNDVAASPRAVPMLAKEQPVVDERRRDRSAHLPVPREGGVGDTEGSHDSEPFDANRQDEKEQDGHI